MCRPISCLPAFAANLRLVECRLISPAMTKCSARENLPDKLGAVLHRLAVPYQLSSRVREALVAYLRSHKDGALSSASRVTAIGLWLLLFG